jgi:Domain of unknown function (DUF6766)
MRGFLRRNGLSLTMFGLFFIFVAGQSLSGWKVYNTDALEHGGHAVSFASYLFTGQFGEGIFENWESEFLQMASYIVLTAYLYQKGSAESKPLPEESDDDSEESVTDDSPGPARRGGWLLKLYESSLGLAFGALFLASIALHALTGAADFNQQQVEHGDAPVSVASFVTTSDFWYQSFQNWQSEYLAMGVMVVFSVYLRQRGSPESKAVEAPHSQTGS